jgi:predicted RNase H-like nuclease (RuvC/YqgF family)
MAPRAGPPGSAGASASNALTAAQQITQQRIAEVKNEIAQTKQMLSQFYAGVRKLQESIQIQQTETRHLRVKSDMATSELDSLRQRGASAAAIEQAQTRVAGLQAQLHRADTLMQGHTGALGVQAQFAAMSRQQLQAQQNTLNALLQ